MKFPIIPTSSYTSIFEFGSGINNKNIILFFNGAQLYFTIYNPSSGTAQTNYYLNYTLTDTDWNHYCINISSAGVWSFYVDGVQISGINFTAYPATTALTNCYLAKSSFQQANLVCFMNQFLVYNRVLTANEIQLLSNYPSRVTFSSSASSTYISPPLTGSYNLFGSFTTSYTVTNQVLTNQNYRIHCASSNGKNLISSQGTYPNFNIYYSRNYGQNWALSNAPTTIYNPLSFCSPRNVSNVFYAGAINGSFKLYRSFDWGATWSLISTAFTNIAGMCVNDADTILYLSNYNVGVYYSTKVGNTSFNYSTNTGTFTFNLITGSNSTTQYAQMMCTPDGMFLYGSANQSNRLFTYNFNNTSSFSLITGTLTTSFHLIAMSSNGAYLYTSLFQNANGLFARSTNGGSTFTITNANILPKNTYATSLYCDITGQYVQIVDGSFNWWVSSNYGVTFAAYSGSIPTSSYPEVFNNNQFITVVQNTATQYGPITNPSYSGIGVPKWVAGGVGSTVAQLSNSTDGISWLGSFNGTSILGYQVNGIAHNGILWVAGGEKTGFSSAVSDLLSLLLLLPASACALR
jgi:hypothetical protein